MSDQSGRQQPFRFWFPYWSNQTPPHPPPPTRGRTQPRPPAPSSRPAATHESQAQQKSKTLEAPPQTSRRPSQTPTPSPSPSPSPSRRSPRFQPSDQRSSEQSTPARSDAQPQPPSTASVHSQPASRKNSRPALLSPSGPTELAPVPSLSTDASQAQPATQGEDKFPSLPATSQLPRTPSMVAAQPQLASRKGASPFPREPVEQAPGPSPSPGASSQPQLAIQVGKKFPSPSPSPQATPDPESPPEQALLPNQPKVLPQESHTIETASPKIPKHETQAQTTSQSKESTPRQLTSQPTELGHQASPDLGPKPVPTAFLVKDVPAETVPKTPNHSLQSDRQPNETKEKPQRDTTAKQETEPNIFPKLNKKHEDIPEGKTKRKTDTDQHPTETSKAENSEEIKTDSKRKAENIQEMHPTRSQKQEKEYQETKVEPKTRPGVKQEINPKEAIKSVPKPEAVKEYNPEGPKPEIIYEEPKTSSDVRRERTTNEATKDGPRSEYNDGYNPKTIPEIDDNIHCRETEESMRKLEPKLAVLVSDFKPSKSQPNTSELTPEDRMSEPEQKMQNGVSGKTATTQHGSSRREGRIDPSMGEQTNLQKEIKESLSKFVQRPSIGHQPEGDQGVSIITLAGKNKGATMIVGYEALDREGSMQPKRDYKTKDKVIAISNNDTRHEQLNHSENGNPDITTNINSNVQSINNSVVHDCSCCQGDPGVHLNISSKPNESVYLI